MHHLTSVLLDSSLRVVSFGKEQVNLCIILFLILFIARLPGPSEKLPVTKIKAKYLGVLRIMKSVTDKHHLEFQHLAYVKNII